MPITVDLDDYKSPSNGLFRFLDTNGNGTGTKNAIGIYGSPVEEFYIQPQGGESLIINRMIVLIGDATAPAAGGYGGMSALTDGISVQVREGANLVLDLTDGLPIKTNLAWGHHCYDVEPSSYGSGINFVRVRWTFGASGKPLCLRGTQRLCVRLSDDFSGLTEHYFMVQGFKD